MRFLEFGKLHCEGYTTKRRPKSIIIIIVVNNIGNDNDNNSTTTTTTTTTNNNNNNKLIFSHILHLVGKRDFYVNVTKLVNVTNVFVLLR